MQYIKRKLTITLALFLLLFTLGAQTLVPAGAFACGSATGSSTSQVLNGVDQTGTDCSGSGVVSAISAAISILSIIIGATAIIMILVSGLRYITAGGDSNKVSAAKTTLTYALVGVAIAALAQVLVHLVLYHTNQAITPIKPKP
jgi:hypothetical protein